jgi:hypothetical protein
MTYALVIPESTRTVSQDERETDGGIETPVNCGGVADETSPLSIARRRCAQVAFRVGKEEDLGAIEIATLAGVTRDSDRIGDG